MKPRADGSLSIGMGDGFAGPAASEGRGGDYAALADALDARAGEILADAQQRFRAIRHDVDLDDPLWNVTSLATKAIVRWLRTGERVNHDDRSKIASVGQAAARQRELVAHELFDLFDPAVAPAVDPGVPGGDSRPAVSRAPAAVDAERTAQRTEDAQKALQLSVAMLTRANFWWSDSTCRVLTEEAHRLGVSEDILSGATAMVMRSCKSSLIDMAERFDAEIATLHQRLAVLVRRDPLTGLANRATFIDQLDRALARLSRQPAGLALIFIDVDDFKGVNDLYGHACGDAVLIELGARLSANVRPGDLVARLGGDEFVLLFEDLMSPGQAERRAEFLRQAAAEPMSVDRADVCVTVSAGVATARFPGKRSEDVLAQADAAMYSAKQAGRNRVAVVEIDGGRRWWRNVVTTQGVRVDDESAG